MLSSRAERGLSENYTQGSGHIVCVGESSDINWGREGRTFTDGTLLMEAVVVACEEGRYERVSTSTNKAKNSKRRFDFCKDQ